jgi:hypothetical protein
MQKWKLIKEFHVEDYMKDDLFHSHAQLPTPIVVSEDTIRIFFASRSIDQKSSIYSIDLKIDQHNGSMAWEKFLKKQILIPGQLGTFDEHGVYPSHVVQFQSKYYLFYIGWNRGYKSPLFYASIGVAISTDGLTFTKLYSGPLLTRGKIETLFATSPFIDVLSDSFRMFYTSGIAWIETNAKVESRYDIKQIDSVSLTDWNSENRMTTIPLRSTETNVARPWIHEARNGSRYMYFSYVESNSLGYKIAMAIEKPGGFWERIDNGLILDGIPDEGMQAYASVVEIQNRTFMFLNGDGYGKHGFLVLESESEI